MINRMILIIKGYSKNEYELEMDNLYIKYYFDFFRSIAGGAYEDEEIIVLNEPLTNDLKQSILLLKPDFAVLVFIGHGSTQDEKQLFWLNRDEIIKAGQLVFEIDKQLIILESCRTETGDINTVDLTDKIPKFKYGGTVRNPISRAKAKELYYSQVNNSTFAL